MVRIAGTRLELSVWELASELTEDEVDEPLYSPERRSGLVSGAKSYLRSTASCRIDFRPGRTGEPRTHYFEAEFQRLTNPSNNPILGPVPSLNEVELSEVELLRQEKDGLRNAVFVVVGQVAEKGQRVDVIALPTVSPPIYSAIRLEVLNEVPVLWSELNSGPLRRLFPLAGGVGNRKLDRFRVAWGSRGRKVACKLPGHLIQRRVQILSDVGNRVGEVCGELPDGRNAGNAEHVISRLPVEIGTDYCLIRSIAEGLTEILFECGKLTIGPAQLSNRGSKQGVLTEVVQRHQFRRDPARDGLADHGEGDTRTPLKHAD